MSITGLERAGYEIRVRATNSEGDSGWSAITVGDPPNSPPTVSGPSNSGVHYMFPFGEPGILEYSGPAGSDPDGDELTYRFTVTLDEMMEETSPPGDAFLSFEAQGNNFSVRASRTVTPAEWNETHSQNGISRRLEAAIRASDSEDESEPAAFTTWLYYDPSAFFPAPAVHQTDNRYEVANACTRPMRARPQASEHTDPCMDRQPLPGTERWGNGQPRQRSVSRAASERRDRLRPAVAQRQGNAGQR